MTVSGSADDDATTETVTLSHSASNGGYDGVSASLEVTVSDIDTVGLTLTPPSKLTVVEANSATYTVKLATEPTADVTVTVSGMGSDVTVDTDSATDGDQDTLSFGTSNWNTGQTVTVSGLADDDATTETVTLSHSASGGDYGTVSETMVVTVSDNDTMGLALNPPSLSVREGSSATYTVQAGDGADGGCDGDGE